MGLRGFWKQTIAYSLIKGIEYEMKKCTGFGRIVIAIVSLLAGIIRETLHFIRDVRAKVWPAYINDTVLNLNDAFKKLGCSFIQEMSPVSMLLSTTHIKRL